MKKKMRIIYIPRKIKLIFPKYVCACSAATDEPRMRETPVRGMRHIPWVLSAISFGTRRNVHSGRFIVRQLPPTIVRIIAFGNGIVEDNFLSFRRSSPRFLRSDVPRISRRLLELYDRYITVISYRRFVGASNENVAQDISRCSISASWLPRALMRNEIQFLANFQTFASIYLS